MNPIDEERFAQELIARAGRPKCPDYVVANILAEVDADARRRRLSPSRVVWIATAAAAALLLAVLPGRFQLEPAPPTALTQAEIDATRAELEQAFSIISQSMTHTSHIVDDQLRENVTGRLLRGVLRTPASTPAETPAAPDSDQSRLGPSQDPDAERNDHA